MKWNLSTVAVWAGLALILLLLINGLWTECTTTDPEYFYYR